MARMITRGPNGPRYSYPNVEMGVTYSGKVAQATAQGALGAAMLMPVILPKGPTNKFYTLDSENAYADFVRIFGQSTVKKAGQPYAALRTHLYNGGQAVLVNLRPDDACYSNAILSATFDKVSKTFYVDADGNLYNEKPDEGKIPTQDVSIDTYKLTPIISNVEDINSRDEIVLAGDNIKAYDVAATVVVPMFAFNYVGASKYGNNYQLGFGVSNSMIKGHTAINAVVYDKKAEVIEGKYSIVFARDVYDNGIPLSLETILQNYSDSIEVEYYDDQIDGFDNVFVTMLEEILTQLDAQIVGGMTELDKAYAEIEALKNVYADGDQDNPALDLFEIIGNTSSEIMNSIFEMNSNTNITVDLKEGNNGSISDMTRFDFDFTIQKDGEDYKVIEDMYIKVFDGTLSTELYDTSANKADYIVDVDFPLTIKKAINNLVEDKRWDMRALLNFPASIKTLDELQAFRDAYGPDNINVHWFGQSYEVMDDAEGKPYRITQAQSIIPLLTSFYQTSIKPIAGQFVPGANARTVLPEIIEPTDRQYCFDNNINIIEKTSRGLMLDGHQGNLIGYEHLAKELHNGLIAGRIMKDTNELLSTKRHMLRTDGNIAAINSALKDNIVDKYRGSADVSVKVGYSSDYDRKIGRVSINFEINGIGTIRQFDVVFNMTNN